MKTFTITASSLYVAAVLFCCFASSVLFDSLNQDLPQYILSVRIDHWVHFLMFLPFPFFSLLVIKCFFYDTVLSRYVVFFAIICGLSFAAFTEAVQTYLIPTREGELSDFLADACGILACSIIITAAGNSILKLMSKIFA